MSILSEYRIEKIKAVTNSQYLDIIGLFVVLAGSFSLGYHTTEVPVTLFDTTYLFPFRFYIYT